MVARLYDKNGNMVDVPDEEVAEGIISGKYRPQSGSQGDIPAFNSEGAFVFLKPETAQKAFKTGKYQYASQQDVTAHQNKQFVEGVAVAREKHLGDATGRALTAAGQGLSDLSLGTAPIIAKGILDAGSALGVTDTSGQEGVDAFNAARETNPGTALATSLATALIPTGAGQITAAGKLASLNLTGTVARSLSKTAENIVTAGKFGPYKPGAEFLTKALTNGMEGLTYGVAQGFSEVALGDPNKAAENIMTAGGMGLLFGSAFGAAGSALNFSAPLFRNMGEGFDKAAERMRKFTSEQIITPIVSSKATRKTFEELRDMDLESKIAFKEGGDEGLKRVYKEVTGAEKELVKDLRINEKEIKSLMETKIPHDQQAIVHDAFTANNGDYLSTIRTLMAQAKKEYAGTEGVIGRLDRTPNSGRIITHGSENIEQTVRNKVFNLTNRLEEFGGSISKKLVKEFESIADAKIYAKNTAADEVLLAKRLRKATDDALYPTKGRAPTGDLKTILDDFREAIDSGHLKGNPNTEVAAHFSKVDPHYAAAINLHKAVFGKLGKASEKSAMAKLSHPDTQIYLESVIKNIEHVAPLFQKLAETRKNAAAQKATAEGILKILNDYKAGTFLELNDTNRLIQVAEMIGVDKTVMSRITNLKQARDLMMKSADMSPANKLFAIKNALGQPVSKELETVIKHETNFKSLAAAKKLSDSGQAILKDTAIKAMAAYGASSLMGMQVSANEGGVLATAYALYKLRRDAYKSAMIIAGIQKTAQTGRARISKAVDKAVKAFKNVDVKRGVVGHEVHKTMAERRDEFKKNKAMLDKLADADALQNEISHKMDMFEGAPNIKMALGTQLTRTAVFLHSKMPRDPMYGLSIFADKTDFTPSDMELEIFGRYVDAAQDPATVIENLAEGTVSPQEIETLRTLYPNVFQDVLDEIMVTLTEYEEDLPYQHKLTLGLLFDIPADVSMTPQFLLTMQSNYVNKDVGGRPRGKRAPQISEQESTEVDRITYG